MKREKSKNKILALTVITTLLISIFLVAIPIIPASASPAEIHVPTDYPTIQAAVGNASSGDTIIIHPGTYTEGPQFVINKNLTITGTDASTTIIKPAGDTGSDGDARGWFLVTAGVDLHFSNLTLDGSGRNIYQAIRHRGQGTVTNCIFKNIVYPTYYGFAIVVFGGNVDVVGCTFSNIGRVGVLFFGTVVTNSMFMGNSYTGKGDGDWLDYGVEVGAGAHVLISGNVISECTGVASVDNSTSAGILVTTYYGAGSQATIINNDISGCTYGIAVGYDGADTSSVVANMNNLYNNDWGIDSTAPTVDARFNWWGDASGPTHSSNVGGIGDAISDYVDYSPWLGFVVGTSPMTFHVNPTGTIQEAIDEADLGDNIVVAAGTYAGAIVDKKVSISGASSGASIITSGVPYKIGSTYYTAFRLDATADGSEIRNFTINCDSSKKFYFAVFSRSADNVIIDSLTVNDAVQGITNWGGSNWEITNNILNNTEAAGGGGIAIWLGALPPTYTVCSGNLIENNIITATATAPDYTCPGIGVGLDLRYGAYGYLTGSEDISNNQILNNNITAPGALHGVGIEIGVLGLEGNATKIAATLGIIHDNTIRDNIIDGADMGIYFYTVTNLAIQQNEIKNCNEGIHIKDGSSGNIINYNNIFGNAVGLNNTVEELIDARYNWWGDPWGPTASPPAGDKVSGNVEYKPWLIEPYPPAVVVSKLYVDPPIIDLSSPEWRECMNFTVEIAIENVTDLYGFEFKLTWNSTLMKLVGIHSKIDGLWTHYWTAFNKTWETDGAGWYWLAVAAQTPAASFNGTAKLVNLVFHIEYTPCYPVVCTTLFNLTDVVLSDSEGEPIPVWVEDGKYTIETSKPKLEMTSAMIKAKKLGYTFDVKIWLLNATKVYDYAFNITYNTTVLDVKNVVIDPTFLPGPYQIMYMQINEAGGWIYVELNETSSGPPANGDGLLVTITFEVTKAVVWKKCQNDTLYSPINFAEWKISVRCPNTRELEGELVGINNAEYWFIPVPGDVNSDGEVNAIDLRMVAKHWDTSEPTVDLNCDGTINVCDLVLVTKHYGEDC